MAGIQAYVSDEVATKINAIVDKRRVEGAREKDVSYSSITTMLVELGMRVYEVQMERKESGFNQMEYNKTILENVLKTQFAISKVLGISSLSPHVAGMPKFEFKTMVENIIIDIDQILARFFPVDESEN